MNLSSLLANVGDSNVKVEWLLSGLKKFNKTKHGSVLSLATSIPYPDIRDRKQVGVLVWFFKDELDSAMAAKPPTHAEEVDRILGVLAAKWALITDDQRAEILNNGGRAALRGMLDDPTEEISWTDNLTLTAPDYFANGDGDIEVEYRNGDRETILVTMDRSCLYWHHTTEDFDVVRWRKL